MLRICKISWLLLAFHFTLILPSSGSSRQFNRNEYEDYCGDLAISCIKACPAFQRQCSSSRVADSVRLASTWDAHSQKHPPSPTYPIINGNNVGFQGPQLNYCDEDAKKRGYCIISSSTEMDCCPPQRCIPFKDAGGKLVAIGYCH